MPQVSLDGIVVDDSIKIAGDSFDEAIVKYAKNNHNMIIGESTAEDIKIHIGSAVRCMQQKLMEVKGRDVMTGLPKTIRISSDDICEALQEPTSRIVEAVHGVLEKMPPELAADIVERGIVLTGGGAMLDGMEELIEEKTGINTVLAENPITAAVIGTGRYVELTAKNNRIDN